MVNLSSSTSNRNPPLPIRQARQDAGAPWPRGGASYRSSTTKKRGAIQTGGSHVAAGEVDATARLRSSTARFAGHGGRVFFFWLGCGQQDKLWVEPVSRRECFVLGGSWKKFRSAPARELKLARQVPARGTFHSTIRGKFPLEALFI